MSDRQPSILMAGGKEDSESNAYTACTRRIRPETTNSTQTIAGDYDLPNANDQSSSLWRVPEWPMNFSSNTLQLTVRACLLPPTAGRGWMAHLDDLNPPIYYLDQARSSLKNRFFDELKQATKFSSIEKAFPRTHAGMTSKIENPDTFLEGELLWQSAVQSQAFRQVAAYTEDDRKGLQVWYAPPTPETQSLEWATQTRGHYRASLAMAIWS